MHVARATVIQPRSVHDGLFFARDVRSLTPRTQCSRTAISEMLLSRPVLGDERITRLLENESLAHTNALRITTPPMPLPGPQTQLFSQVPMNNTTLFRVSSSDDDAYQAGIAPAAPMLPRRKLTYPTILGS